MRKLYIAGLTLLLCGLGSRGAQAQPFAVRTVRYEGADYIVADADMSRVRLHMLSRGDDIQSFKDAEAALRSRGERALLVANGGIFDPGTPVGLHVEDGSELHALRLGSTPAPGQSQGNFYSLPNAVLYQDRNGRIAIRESSAMHGQEGIVRDGLQSGPALLLNGAVHPLARPSNRGTLHDRRTMACMAAPGHLSIIFAKQPRTLPQVAQFLRDRLGCRDAVYIDAVVTGLYIPGSTYIPPHGFVGVLALTTAGRE